MTYESVGQLDRALKKAVRDSSDGCLLQSSNDKT